MLTENSMINNNFDWNTLEAHVRSEISDVLKPWREQMINYKE